MIEEILQDYLIACFPDIPVLMEIPEKEPNKCIVVSMTGGNGSKFLRSSTFAIRSIAETKYAACALNNDVIEAMLDMPEKSDDVSKTEMTGNTELPDASKKTYQYQSVFDLAHY